MVAPKVPSCPEQDCVDCRHRHAVCIPRRYADIEKDSRKYRAAYDHVLGLLRSTKREHGLCQPRERKACTACNAQEELDIILSGWKGGAIYPA